MAVTQATRLGCGRDVDDVWHNVDQPPNAHEQTCPYCIQARSDLAELSSATHELTTADRQDPTLRVPAQMLSDILAIVRIEVRRGRTLPLQRLAGSPRGSVGSVGSVVSVVTGDKTDTSDSTGDASHGPDEDWEAALTVSEQLIATVVRETCDRNPDVEVRRVSIDAAPLSASHYLDHPHTGSSAPALEPADVVMDLQVTVSNDSRIPGLLNGLRHDLTAAVTTQIGVGVSRINVLVQDLHDA